jgi:putative ABC transport system permease protein
MRRSPPIRKQFLLEAVLLRTIGGPLGLGVGHACARVVPSALAWHIAFIERMAMIAIACSTNPHTTAVLTSFTPKG